MWILDTNMQSIIITFSVHSAIKLKFNNQTLKHLSMGKFKHSPLNSFEWEAIQAGYAKYWENINNENSTYKNIQPKPTLKRKCIVLNSSVKIKIKYVNQTFRKRKKNDLNERIKEEKRKK